VPSSEFKIDHAKVFPNLRNTPIVEAVLHWQAAASVKFEESTLIEELKLAFPEYRVEQQHNLEAAFKGTSKGMEVSQAAYWDGVRLTKSENDKPVFVCQFKQNGIVFSRLAPYLDWENFESEAQKFWRKFIEFGKPVELARLSVRFISQIQISSMSDIESYIDVKDGPLKKIGVSPGQFFHQDTVYLDSQPYIINLTRAVQPSADPATDEKLLIVDIDTHTKDTIAEFDSLTERLMDLRFIKNEVFFALMIDAKSKFGANEE